MRVGVGTVREVGEACEVLPVESVSERETRSDIEDTREGTGTRSDQWIG